MLISEIFNSIEGEGIRSGYLATFIRTYGCNLRCNYCDSIYAVDETVDLFGNKNFKQMTVQDIVNECKHIGNERITFTGGEPLIQKDAKELIDELLGNHFEVNIETNGAVPIKDFIYFKNRDLSKLIITMDWKSPYSGMRDKMIEENLKDLRSFDVLKFVVATKEDLDDMKNTLENNGIYCNVFVSPVFGKIEPFEIVDYLKQNNLQNTRVQLQIHKLIWDKNMRGV
jgi:7-carboxy-7-deazaguanine synthase